MQRNESVAERPSEGLLIPVNVGSNPTRFSIYERGVSLVGGPQKSKDKLLKELEYLMDDAWSRSLHFDMNGRVHKDVVALRELVRKERKKLTKED